MIYFVSTTKLDLKNFITLRISLTYIPHYTLTVQLHYNTTSSFRRIQPPKKF